MQPQTDKTTTPGYSGVRFSFANASVAAEWNAAGVRAIAELVNVAQEAVTRAAK